MHSVARSGEHIFVCHLVLLDEAHVNHVLTALPDEALRLLPELRARAAFPDLDGAVAATSNEQASLAVDRKGLADAPVEVGELRCEKTRGNTESKDAIILRENVQLIAFRREFHVEDHAGV